jgi:inner membrane protein
LSVLGIVAAEFPDSDLVYSGPLLDMGALGYLLHHRGHTHTIVWAVVSAVVLWMVARWWVNYGSSRSGSSDSGKVSAALLVVALVGTLSHLLLDYTNSYGVHPFWPFDGRWYYGDAVFIVEPWLWLVAIPALFWHRPSRVGKVLLPLFFLLILAAVLLLGQVARDVAVLLVCFAVVWPLLQWKLRPVARTASGLAAWALVTVAFFAASGRAEAAVRDAVAASASSASGGAPDEVLDVVLNPGPGDWGCWSALVMSRSDGRYRVTSAFVAPLGSARSLTTCTARYRAGRIGSDVLAGLDQRSEPVFRGTAAVTWRSSWSVPLSEFEALTRARCEVDAALHFMRAPVWQRMGAGQLLLSDARFGVGGGGFSEVILPATGACSLQDPWIPGWEPPRADVLGPATGD